MGPPGARHLDAGHWTFVSSLGVYDGDGLHEPFTEESADMEKYGPIKVASENAVREARGESAFIIRAG